MRMITLRPTGYAYTTRCTGDDGRATVSHTWTLLDHNVDIYVLYTTLYGVLCSCPFKLIAATASTSGPRPRVTSSRPPSRAASGGPDREVVHDMF